MSGPLAQWAAQHYELDPHARFVLVTLALQAEHDGTAADLTREQIEERTGLSRSAIARALREIEKAKAVAQGPVPGRGRPRQRLIRVWWCDKPCFTCELLANFTAKKGAASGTSSRQKGATRPEKGFRQWHPKGT